MFDGPEKKFQRHIADFLIREHKFALLDQSDITDTDYYVAEDHLIAFIQVTQKETFEKLEEVYNTDARDQILRALKNELDKSPLWLIMRQGLKVRGLNFKLYYPKPRSSDSVANKYYKENRLYFKDELVIRKGKRPDFVLFLNGLPVITIELKHEKNETVHDAVRQYAERDHSDPIFQLPFIHIAADTSDVMVATDPSREENFRWYNSGLTNKPITSENEYAVEYLYRYVLAPDSILEALSFYLIYVPHRDAAGDRQERPAFTIFPRYHQSRMVNKLADNITAHFSKNSSLGKKYLIDHSAGSGKTLSICWLADRLHSLYEPGTGEKTVNIIFILTDRKDLDKNIKDDIENFSHLSGVIAFAKTSADLKRYICDSREQIIVSTLQKFKYILTEIENNDELKKLRVAFLIDEAHRSQEGRMGVAIRVPFRDKDTPDQSDEDDTDPEDDINKIIRAHAGNQLFVAFTATPSDATVQLFGAPFDTYSEAEAIEEGYIIDVATGIISYKVSFRQKCVKCASFKRYHGLF